MAKRKVLVPMDGSEFSRQIVRVVRSFFDPKDVRLVLFRAANPPAITAEVEPQDVIAGSMPLAGTYDSYNRALDAEFLEVTKERETFRTQILDEMRGDAERLQKDGYDVAVEVHFGDPAQRIVDFVNDEDVDLVAMATHGRSGIGRLVMGSVAERVLRGVTVPVLLIRSVAEPTSRATPGEELAQSLGNGQQLKITVATDGSTLAQQGVALACDLARAMNAKLTVLAVASDRDPASHARRIMEAVHEAIEGQTPRPTVTPLVGYADEVLLHHLAENPTDLFIMGAFQDRGAGSMTAIGPTAQRMAQNAPTSVWMAKGRRGSIRRVLASVAVDDSTVLDVAAQVARAVGAELGVLHVVPPAAASYLATLADDGGAAQISVADALAQGTHLSSILQGWTEQLERQGVEQDCLMLERGSAAETILRVAHNGNYDLIVVGSQSGPGQFLGSVANSVVRFAEQSVLVVRTRNL